MSSGEDEGINGMETVWEGGNGGARERNSGQVSRTVWEGGNGGARDRNVAEVSIGDGEGTGGRNSMGRGYSEVYASFAKSLEQQ